MEVRDNNDRRAKLAADMPPIDAVLVAALEHRFPARYPDIAWTDREIWLRAGQRSLVEFLHQHYNKQQEE